MALSYILEIKGQLGKPLSHQNNEFVEGMAGKNVCTKFEDNWSILSTMRGQIHIINKYS